MSHLSNHESIRYPAVAALAPRLNHGFCALRYPCVAAALAIALPVGLLMLRAAAAHTWPSRLFIMAELATDPLGYLYVFLASAAALMIPATLLGLHQDRLERLAITDALTGLPNRRYLLARLIEEVARAQRYHTPLALLVLDLDRLKHINDSQGHGAGDRAIATVAATLLGTLRTSDLPARYAGDEFVALLPQTSAVEALRLARRIGVQLRLRGELSAGPTLSVSIGVADLGSVVPSNPEALIAAADAALYAAKAQGRGCVVAAHAAAPVAERVEAG